MRLLTSIIVLASCEALEIPSRPCTVNGHAGSGKVLSVSIDNLPAGGCDYLFRGVKTCQFNAFQSYNLTTVFHAVEDSLSAVTKVTLNAQGISLPLMVKEPNACIHGVKCPIQAGMTITFSASVTLPNLLATGVLEWTVLGDNSRPIFCFVFPFRMKLP